MNYLENFIDFIENFKDENGKIKYLNRINEMIKKKSKIFVIDFLDLYNFNYRLTLPLFSQDKEIYKEIGKTLYTLLSNRGYGDFSGFYINGEAIVPKIVDYGSVVFEGGIVVDTELFIATILSSPPPIQEMPRLEIIGTTAPIHLEPGDVIVFDSIIEPLDDLPPFTYFHHIADALILKNLDIRRDSAKRDIDVVSRLVDFIESKYKEEIKDGVRLKAPFIHIEFNEIENFDKDLAQTVSSNLSGMVKPLHSVFKSYILTFLAINDGWIHKEDDKLIIGEIPRAEGRKLENIVKELGVKKGDTFEFSVFIKTVARYLDRIT